MSPIIRWNKIQICGKYNFCNISSEETTYAIMKHSSQSFIMLFILYKYFGFQL